jgi:hypothetical protein
MQIYLYTKHNTPQHDVETVAVHIRRTDYALYPGKHDFLEREYYEQVSSAYLQIYTYTYIYMYILYPGKHDFLEREREREREREYYKEV